MQDYYVSFGSDHFHNIDGLVLGDKTLVKIQAQDLHYAREFAHQLFDRNFCTVRTHDQLTGLLALQVVEVKISAKVVVDKVSLEMEEDMDEIKADFLSWSGGETPGDEHQITVYVDYAMSSKYDSDEVRCFLNEWSQSEADRSSING